MDPGIVFRPDQIQDLGVHLANDRHGLGHEPGVGKTPIVCLLAYFRWTEEQAMTVWPQPTSLLKKNLVELLRFTEFEPHEVVILREDHKKLSKAWTGPTHRRIKKTRHDTGLTDEDGKKVYTWTESTEVVGDLIAAAALAGAKVVLCGYRFFTLHWERILEAFPQMNQCIIDEAHKAYGGNESQNTLALYAAMRRLKYFAPMTATLLDGRLDSVFPVLHIIEPRYYGSYDGFLSQHAGWIDKYNKVTSWINTDKVKILMARHFSKRTFEATYGKEAVVFFHETIDMSEAHRAKYNEFHDLAMLELEDGELLDGSLPGVATIRARQIMSHPETMGLLKGEMTGKDERIEVHAGSSGPLIVFSVHVAEQLRLVKLLEAAGRKVGLINGSVVGAQRAGVDERFRSGQLDTLVVSPVVADVGFNWGTAEHIIFTTLDYSDVTFQQAYRRGLRGKRTKHLRVTTLAYEDSIDQRVLEIAVKKSTLANQVDPDRPVLSFTA